MRAPIFSSHNPEMQALQALHLSTGGIHPSSTPEGREEAVNMIPSTRQHSTAQVLYPAHVSRALSENRGPQQRYEGLDDRAAVAMRTISSRRARRESVGCGHPTCFLCQTRRGAAVRTKARTHSKHGPFINLRHETILITLPPKPPTHPSIHLIDSSIPARYTSNQRFRSACRG